MKKFYSILILIFLAFSFKSYSQFSMKKLINENLKFAAEQYTLMAKSLLDKDNLLPRTLNKKGEIVTCKSSWWTSGFFPGSLWYLYEYSKNEEIKHYAEVFTTRVEDQQYTTDNHDVGFMIFCSFGNGYKIAGKDEYLKVIINGAKSLSKRFNPTVGCIRSWDWGPWQFPVIIDNMMNLEILFFATAKTNDSSFYNIAISHAIKTLANHFRSDGSCYHVLSYDTITGKVITKQTRQGYSDESAWARGQAWALYGFTMTYRETKNPIFLEQAKKIANFIINHKNFPKDGVPYWDFDDPQIPNTYRDASAGAIICSALLELQKYVDKKHAKLYLKVAKQQIKTLSSSKFRANLGENGNFILKHSVGSKPENSELDVPLTYADYYYIEALIRYKKLKKF